MNLPPRAISALTAIKQELLSKASLPEVEIKQEKTKKKEPRRVARHARTRSSPFQTACRRKDWWSPVY